MFEITNNANNYNKNEYKSPYGFDLYNSTKEDEKSSLKKAYDTLSKLTSGQKLASPNISPNNSPNNPCGTSCSNTGTSYFNIKPSSNGIYCDLKNTTTCNEYSSNGFTTPY